jgi:hypothetical protein
MVHLEAEATLGGNGWLKAFPSRLSSAAANPGTIREQLLADIAACNNQLFIRAKLLIAKNRAWDFLNGSPLCIRIKCESSKRVTREASGASELRRSRGTRHHREGRASTRRRRQELRASSRAVAAQPTGVPTFLDPQRRACRPDCRTLLPDHPCIALGGHQARSRFPQPTPASQSRIGNRGYRIVIGAGARHVWIRALLADGLRQQKSPDGPPY